MSEPSIDPPGQIPEGVTAQRRSGPLVVIAVVVAAVIVGSIALAVTRGDSGPDRKQALELCHQMVKAKLKSPATASFDADKKASIGSASSGSGAGNLVIDGTVDSQNGFSAVVRSSYFCIVRRSGSRYTIDDSDVIVV